MSFGLCSKRFDGLGNAVQITLYFPGGGRLFLRCGCGGYRLSGAEPSACMSGVCH